MGLQARLHPEVRALAVGNWTAQLVGDELANIRYAGRPVLRAIKAVIRDHEWRTLDPAVRDLAFLEDDDGVTLRFHVDYAGGDARYEAMVKVRLTPLTVDVEFNGRAKTAFRRNRIGLVVLHPASEAGREITAVSPDGGITTRRFPEEISPNLIFTDVASLEWADAGTAFDLGFTGDVFETEDQRNWTDASFKTYSTPSSAPIPVDVAVGDVVRQSVSLEAVSIETPDLAMVSERPAPSLFSIGEQAGTVPPLALGLDSIGTGDTGTAEVPALPGLDAITVELYGSEAAWTSRLQAAAREAAVHGAALDVRIVADELPDVRELLGQAGQAQREFSGQAEWSPAVARLGIFTPRTNCTEPATFTALRRALEETGFDGDLLVGTRSHFTELNTWAKGGVPQDAAALTYSITPQTHSTEIAHIVETIPIQRLTARNALRLAGGKPVHIGPITLKRHLHAPDEAPETDELQGHIFTAAWTLASISSLTLEGIASISYFEAAPPRGIRREDGLLTPAGELLQLLAPLRGAAVLEARQDSPEGSPVTLYPVVGPAGLRLFTANLGPRQETVQVSLPPAVPASSAPLSMVGARNGSHASASLDGARLTLVLEPWSTAVVDFS